MSGGLCPRPNISVPNISVAAFNQRPNTYFSNCEFDSRSVEVYSIQHYVIKIVIDLWQVGGFLWVLCFLHQLNWPPRYNWNIVESDIKHHNLKFNPCILTFFRVSPQNILGWQFSWVGRQKQQTTAFMDGLINYHYNTILKIDLHKILKNTITFDQ